MVAVYWWFGCVLVEQHWIGNGVVRLEFHWSRPLAQNCPPSRPVVDPYSKLVPRLWVQLSSDWLLIGRDLTRDWQNGDGLALHGMSDIWVACLKIHPLIIIGLTLDWRHLSCASCARDTSVVSYLELVPLSIRGIKHGLTVDWQWNDYGLTARVVSYSSVRVDEDWQRIGDGLVLSVRHWIGRLATIGRKLSD